MKRIPRRWWLLSLLGMGATCAEPIAEEVYELVPVPTRDITVSASAAGSVEPVQTIEVKSKASGEIIEVLVDVGDLVGRGDPLVRVDPRVPRNALVQAEADLDVARAQLTNAESRVRRADALFESQSITEQEWEDARLNYANANAALVRAERLVEDSRIAFEDTEVRAAARGMILTRQVEVGTVIQSASSGLAGGAVLMTMANLDTVQVRTLVDETDIGKIQPGMPVTIRVDAYPNQPFEGRVLKIEPAALVEQNVTMFPVLVRISNEASLLRTGMSSEVEIHIGERRGVIAVPNVALRTDRDYSSAAVVLGLDPTRVAEQLSGDGPSTGSPPPDRSPAPDEVARTVTMFDREIPVPAGVDFDALEAAIAKAEAAGGGREGMAALDDSERQLVRGVMQAAFGGRSGGDGRPRRGGAGGPPRIQSSTPEALQGDYIVFVLRSGEPAAIRIRTGLTDLDYTEVLDGLTASDTLVLLPSRPLGGG